VRFYPIAGWLLVGSLCSAKGSPAAPLFKDFMGINGHTVQFRPQLYRPIASRVRDYHPVEWDLGQDSEFVTVLPMARNGVDWNKVYGSWRQEGWRIDVSVMFESLARDKWKEPGKDTGVYAESFARALGPSSSAALVDSVEIGNEPGTFNDSDYRIIFESMAHGFKKGDQRLRVATCALTTGKSHPYAKSVDCVAGLESLYDILNVHSYAELEGWPTWQRSYPEDRRLKNYLQDVLALCRWRDQRAPGKEVWLTEFGYDASTKSPDPKTEFKQWRGVNDTQQAQWIVRSWLVFAALPVQRAYLYFFNDEDAPQVHGSSGLTRHFQPKPAFYAAAQLQRCLGEYRFNRVLQQREGDAYLYEFTHASDPARRVWVAWSPTGSERESTLELPAFEGRIDRAERLVLDQHENPLTLDADAHKVPLTESPLYLFLK
jgi:hypothetical protein